MGLFFARNNIFYFSDSFLHFFPAHIPWGKPGSNMLLRAGAFPPCSKKMPGTSIILYRLLLA